jgi:hypothetical protein|tara:strand:+ start:341 stop:493 length:153 start_codon:yes stop_codon:yes gene_type:complete
MLDIFVELFKYFRSTKKWWLIPIIVFLALLGSLIVLTQGTALTPFIYTIF